MFYRNTLKTIKSEEKEFEYEIFSSLPNCKSDEQNKVGSTSEVYNFETESGALKAGFGFEDLKSPSSTTDLENESIVNLRGDEIYAIWRLKWYDHSTDTNNYYIFYFNDENLICYENLFMQRFATVIVPNNFTQTPYATYYRNNSQDALLLSGEGDNLMVITGNGTKTNELAPLIKSCCSHYGMLFAVTSSASSTLIYNEDTDITNWTDEKTSNLDFSDERGDLNKIISFDDYIFIFRDYGITKLSIYSSDEEFSINHMYLSDSYIYPNSIAQCGDNVYFLERSGLKRFNGSQVYNVDSDINYLLKECEQKNCYGVAFDGKYYLACRLNFDDGETVGCENYEGGYINNALVIYDYTSGHVNIVRGVDINMLLALNNPYKAKLVACFNNQYIGKIGQLTNDGQLFGVPLPSKWISTKTDLGYHGQKKRIKAFLIKSLSDITVTISSEKESKSYKVLGKEKIQKIKTNVIGNEFIVKISAENQTNISNFILIASIKQ